MRILQPTTRTNASDLDIGADLPDGHGRHVPFAELIERATRADLGGLIVCVASLDDVIASRSGPTAPRTEWRCQSSAGCAVCATSRAERCRSPRSSVSVG